MSDDLISRQAVIYGKIYIQRSDGVEIYDDYAVPVSYLKQLPPADRPTGEWIKSEFQNEEDVQNDNYLYNCSECGRGDLHAKGQIVPYCWWCGAMIKGTDDE